MINRKYTTSPVVKQSTVTLKENNTMIQPEMHNQPCYKRQYSHSQRKEYNDTTENSQPAMLQNRVQSLSKKRIQ
jgi:N-acetylmuramoyl-L-alanine amidase CwlA